MLDGLAAASARVRPPASTAGRPRSGRRFRARLLDSAPMDNEMVKRLVWSGLLAGIGALASIATTKLAAVIWRRAFGEDPPE